MLLFLVYVIMMMTGEEFSDDLEIGTKEVETMIRTLVLTLYIILAFLYKRLHCLEQVAFC